mgnify:CR=1 FL=1
MGQATFIGMENYKTLLHDKSFGRALLNSLLLAIGFICIQHPIAIVVAAVLDKLSGKAEGFFRCVYFIPNVISVAVIAYLWKFIYNPDFGLLNNVLKVFGYQGKINWFSADNAIWSVNSGYGGDVLLGKKCFALRIASCQARDEGWMAEHMLILGLTKPDGKTRYICAAFPSACGKTNLAMLIPPEGYMRKGYKITTVGDDIAWLRPGKNGGLYAVNPENGFFGVAPGTNAKSNPNALASTSRDTIFTNVVQNLDDNTVWWEGLNKTPPARAIDWRGRPWTPQSPEKAAHPNSRFTAPARNCPCLSPEFDNPEGVPISAIIFGGRRAKTAPLVYQSFSWQHGVFIGSIMASETTAAATGQVGVVRRDPMAMLPFCGYHMGDYWQHWLDMGKKIPKPPKIFNVNWFRTDEDGNFAWPGFGDNMRVLQWIISRADNEIGAAETALGYEPNTHDIDMEGLDMSMYDMRRLLSVDRDLWLKECEDARAYYEKIGKVPPELYSELDALEMRLNRGYKVEH